MRMPDTDDEDAPAIAGGGFIVVTTPYGNNRNLAAPKGRHLLYRLSEQPIAMATI